MLAMQVVGIVSAAALLVTAYASGQRPLRAGPAGPRLRDPTLGGGADPAQGPVHVRDRMHPSLSCGAPVRPARQALR